MPTPTRHLHSVLDVQSDMTASMVSQPQPIGISGAKIQNQILYSAENGKLAWFRVVDVGEFTTKSSSLYLLESTAVLPDARLSLEDAGLWNDDQIEPMKHIVDFIHSQHQNIGVQLAHAGPNALVPGPGRNDGTASGSCYYYEGHLVCPPFKQAESRETAPADSCYHDHGITICPHIQKAEVQPITLEEIKVVTAAFVNATTRALEAGVDIVEIDGAEGSLLESFLSLVTNKRFDKYGVSFENRTRLTVEIVDAVRSVIPPYIPLLFRMSSEWLGKDFLMAIPPDIDDVVSLLRILAEHGVNFIDVASDTSSGHNILPMTSLLDYSYISTPDERGQTSEAVGHH